VLHQRIEEGGVALVARENLMIEAADILAPEALEKNDDDVFSRKARITR
jgi:hypothetical protein